MERIAFTLNDLLSLPDSWNSIKDCYDRTVIQPFVSEQLCREYLPFINALNFLTNDELQGEVSALTTVCRTIETRERYGFESNEYQSLIQNPTVQESILEHDECVNNHEEFSLPANADLLRAHIGKDALLHGSLNPISSTDINNACYNITNFYLKSWSDAAKAYMKDYSWTFVIFPYVYLSLFKLRNDAAFLRRIFTSSIGCVPCFNSEKLWLQRKSMELLISTHGIHTLLPFDPEVIRPIYIYTMAQKLGLSQADKESLAASIKNAENFEDVDYMSHDIADALLSGKRLLLDFDDIDEVSDDD